MSTPATSARNWVLGVGLLVASLAWADKPAKVPLQVDVVSVSNEGTVLEPATLKKMKDTFDRQGLSFTAYRQLSSARLEVSAEPPTELKLPNGRTVSLRLDKLDKDSAQVKLSIPGLLDESRVTLGKAGTVYQQAGNHRGGKLVLVLSPSR